MSTEKARNEWDTSTFYHLLKDGVSWLQRHEALVNAINVFPVPDADTGTNVLLTTDAGLREVEIKRHEMEMSQLLTAMAHGSLMGARGNGGVIVSQFFRGMARAAENTPSAVMDGLLLVSCLQSAAKYAPKAVIRPIEGTILTTLHAVADEAKRCLSTTHDLPEILAAIATAAHKATTESPAMIDVLVDCGCVDAGAVTLSLLLEGMYHSVNGVAVEEWPTFSSKRTWAYERLQHLRALDRQFLALTANGQVTGTVANLVYSALLSPCSRAGTYVTNGVDRRWLRQTIDFWATRLFPQFGNYPFAYLRPIDCSVLDSEKRLRRRSRSYREHIIAAEGRTTISSSAPMPFPFIPVAVCSDDGFSRLFELLGVPVQLPLFNLTAETVCTALRATPSENVILLANNTDVLPLLDEIREKVQRESRRNITILETENEIQGIAALTVADPTQTFETNAMLMAIGKKSVTVVSTGIETRTGSYVGFINGQRQGARYSSYTKAMQDTLASALKPETRYVDVYGSRELYELTSKSYPDLEVNYFPDTREEAIALI